MVLKTPPTFASFFSVENLFLYLHQAAGAKCFLFGRYIVGHVVCARALFMGILENAHAVELLLFTKSSK
jgi:hypothetical protein